MDRFLSAELDRRVSATRPYAWGVTELVIDEDLATLGKFGVIRLAGVLPDGTRFAIPDDMPPPPPLDLPAEVSDAVIHLTLPAAQPGAVMFEDEEAAGPASRFLVSESEVADVFSADRTREPVEVARPHLRFGVTRDDIYGRVCLGLARVRELQNRRAMFDDRFVPPAQDLRASPRLRGGLSDILGRATQRVEELALRAVEATDGGAETFASFLLLQCLNRWCPVLGHLQSMPDVHPERLFEQLAAMTGELATLTRADRRPPPLPVYDHENLQATFEPVFDLLRAMLSAVFDRSAIQLPLEAAGPGAYVSTITDHQLYRTGYFYLAVNAAAPLDEIRQRFPAMAKIGAVQKMRAIVESALPGVPLRHAPTPPPQLRVLPGYLYFELDRGVPDWRDFATAPALGLHLAGEWPALKMELWCVKRAEQ
ncbi:MULTISPECIES: type VI secretion system baseplate subunit TssK [Sphingomonas]|nr:MULTISPECIES: type VI secretion system baseplate subunit TssK [Sphingomonas]